MPLPKMKHITKSFAGVYVNEDVDLSIEQGEIHALLGKNGAGKTMLMNILFDIYQTGKREICLKGEHVGSKSSGEVAARGIGMVYQHLLLMKKMMVLDNVMLGLKGQGIVADRELVREKLTDLVVTYGLLMNPEVSVYIPPVGEQQRVEILKVLYQDVSLLILNEPTGVLIPQEIENLFGVSRRLRDKGYGIIIITHRLGEIMDISNWVTVLRDGQKVNNLITEETAPEELFICMVGRGLKTGKGIREFAAGGTALNLKDVCLHRERSTKVSPDHVNLTIRREEILGVAGVEGNGQKELAKAMTEIRRINSGQMGYQEKDIRRGSVKERFRADIFYVSGDCHDDSLVMDMTVEGNLILRDFDRQPFSWNMVLDHRQAEKRVRKTLDEYSIRTSGKSGSKTPVKLVSDGNQQKVILSREISEEAGLIVASQPAKGLDIGTTWFIHGVPPGQRDAGKYVLLISADLGEILGVGDRVTVMYEGRIIGILNRGEADIHKTGLLMGDIAKETAGE